MIELTIQQGNETITLVPDDTWVYSIIELAVPQGKLHIKIQLPRQFLSMPTGMRKALESEVVEAWKDMIDYARDNAVGEIHSGLD